MSNTSNDIRAKTLTDLDWSPGSRAVSLRAMVEHAIAQADEAIEWYLKAKSGTRRAARLLRMGAILLTAAAGILPVLQQIFAAPDGSLRVAAAWPSVLVALAALLIAIDQFYGFSSAWARYITAELAIKRAREVFELDWQAADASFAGQDPTEVQTATVIAVIRAFTAEVNAIVANETAQWVADFRAALRQVEEAAKVAESHTRGGSVVVTVDNGDTVDAPGWALSLDSGGATTYTGKTAARSGIEPGDHVVRVTGRVGGRDARAETVAQVQAGVVATVQVTLA